MELNKTFIDGLWSKEINVTSFVQTNITPYLGDASFLQGPTERTRHIWNLCLKALEEERQRNGIRSLDNKTVSTITSHKAGYIDREQELIVGLQTDELLKRAIKPFGGIRNAVMFKDFGLVAGFVTIILTVLVGNLILGKFNPGFTGQPVAHNDGLWNFLGTALMGWGCVLLGGCPLRQLILAGQGESDSAVTVLGMMCGAAFCHNLKLASSADGPTGNGKIAVIVGFVVVLVVSLLFTKKAEE